MAAREFRFNDGSSDKFWRITVSGSDFTVHFGRTGTTGQAQEKTFASEAAAKTAADKLIAEKTGKGYKEVGASAVATPPVTVKAPATPKAKETPAAAPAAATPGASSATKTASAPAPKTAAAPIASSAESRILLDADEWSYATWRGFPTRPAETPRPFDLAARCAEVARIPVNIYGWVWDFDAITLPRVMGSQEANFWFAAMQRPTKNHDPTTPQQWAEKLSKQTFTETTPLTKIDLSAIPEYDFGLNTFLVLRHLVTLDCYLDCVVQVGESSKHRALAQLSAIAHLVVSLLTDAERAAWRDLLRPQVTPIQWDLAMTRQHHVIDASPFLLAARLGMNDEMRAVIGTWKVQDFEHKYPKRVVLDLIMGLGSTAAIIAEAERMQVLPLEPDQMRAWLATTGFTGLPRALAGVLSLTDKDNARRLAEVVALAAGPQAAPIMLAIREDSKAAAVGRAWLDAHPALAVRGLAPLIGTNAAHAGAALDLLRLCKRKLGTDLFTAALPALDPATAARLRTLVIDHQSAEESHALVDAGEPPWFDPAAAGIKKGKLPTWADAATLPSLIWNSKRLTDAHIATVLQALRDSESGKALVIALRKNLDAKSSDTFAWALFKAWMADGASSKEKWAMLAIGHLGGPACVQQLTPLIRAWPGESQHQRAVAGLEVLRTIGSDLALMQLNGIAQKLPFKGLKQKAAECMERIASERGFTRAQLEDRIVPDCDLDDRGLRVFDFGPRQFTFALGPDLKPALRDGAGKTLSTLPKPLAKDDQDKSAAATADWKLFKKQVGDTVAIQSGRLEQAMVTGRHWPAADFQTLLVNHPLLIHIVRRLLWSTCDATGKRGKLLRISEEREAVDAEDNPIDLSAATTVGLVHPLHLDDQEKGTWGQIFTDYGIVAPFAQLARAVHLPTADEIAAGKLSRFIGLKFPAPTLVFGLEKLGWNRGAAIDGGAFCELGKVYESAGCTAVLDFEGNVGMGYMEPDEILEIRAIHLVAGICRPRDFDTVRGKKQVYLDDADPVVLSELINDLLQLAAKAT